MPLSVGDKLGHYEVLSLLGQGGMGEVYRARDTTLKRDVALKVLPAALRDPERMVRFQREAEVLASLDHPNIGPIHGIVDSADSRALVLALIEGPTLSDRIEAGALPPEEALHVARQIIEALEYAHDRGVVHRDLKPANVKITPDGIVKVLDFGLAKVLEDEPPASPLANSPTLTLGHTRAGVILGTAAYMSPEQAVGRPVDRRSDIFSFGAVLYEMLSGKRAFAGAATPDVLEAVVKTDPDWSKLPPETSRVIGNLLRRCLAKDRKQRLQAIGEARIVLEDPYGQPIRDREGADRTTWIAIAAALLLALAAGWALGHFRGAGEEPTTVKLFLPPPEKTNYISPPYVSPDGKRLAFTATADGRSALWVRDMNSLTTRPLPGTEGALADVFWSPDSRFVAFFADGKIKRIAGTGGPVTTVCGAENPRGGSWGSSGVIVFAPAFGQGGLFRCPAAGAAAVPLTTAENGDYHRYPWFLPDGRHFLYTARSADPEKSRVYVGDLESQTRRVVLAANSNAQFTSGYLMFMRGLILVAQPFDTNKAETFGEEVPVAEQVNFDSLNVKGSFAASQSGVLAFSSGRIVRNAELTWFDRSGRVIGTMGTPGPLALPVISPAEDTVAYTRGDSQTGLAEIWLHDVRRNSDSRFLFHQQYSTSSALWSADDSQVYFSSVRPGTGVIFRRATGGTARDEVLLKDALGNSPVINDLSKDGRFLVAQLQFGKTKEDLWLLPQFGDRKPIPYVQTEASEHNAKISTNGQWLAYASDETKRNEVYVQSFPDPGTKLPVSTSGGGFPVWSRDGRQLYFIGPNQKMMAADVKTGMQNGKPTFEAGVPRPLFDVRTNGPFDVSKDGRFLMTVPVEQSAALPFTVVLNWQAGLKK